MCEDDMKVTSFDYLNELGLLCKVTNNGLSHACGLVQLNFFHNYNKHFFIEIQF